MPAPAAKSGLQHSVRRDDRYRCINPGCLCEIKISRAPFVGTPITQNVRCCCGCAMERVS